ncbi:hypothetical protein AB1N83_007155 [Pleurotus pulmonarius]
MRSSLKIGLLLLPVSLGLFFGLFFGIAYPEVVRHGWPLSKCDILSARLDPRYCSCSTQTRAQTMLPRVLRSKYVTEGTIAAQTVAIPAKLARIAVQVARRPVPSLALAIRAIAVAAQARLGDFGKDQSRAQSFYDRHPVNSTSTCYYNPKTMNEVDFDVSFTPWRWAVTSLFGFLPLLLNLGFFVVLLVAFPAWRWFSAWRRGRAESQAPPPYQEREKPEGGGSEKTKAT